jgi:hypothetical protein
MGEVWLAHDARVDRDIAVKLMRVGQGDPGQVARFLREARVQGRLDHPCIVPVHDLAADAATPFFAMKRVTGTTLAHVIATRDEERYAREYPTLQVSLCDTIEPGERTFGVILFEQTSYGSREEGKDWTGNSVYLWAIANAVYMALMGPQGFRDIGRAIRMSEKLQAGTVWVNTYRAVSFRAPFGGYKDSGLGRESGQDAIQEYLQTKCVWINTGVTAGNPFVLR